MTVMVYNNITFIPHIPEIIHYQQAFSNSPLLPLPPLAQPAREPFMREGMIFCSM
jgi:hypothetical protein